MKNHFPHCFTNLMRNQQMISKHEMMLSPMQSPKSPPMFEMKSTTVIFLDFSNSEHWINILKIQTDFYLLLFFLQRRHSEQQYLYYMHCSLHLSATLILPNSSSASSSTLNSTLLEAEMALMSISPHHQAPHTHPPTRLQK